MQIRPFERADEAAVVALWEECRLTRSWNDPRKDIARKLAEHLEGLLLERGCPKVNLLVRASNPEAVAFYAGSATRRTNPSASASA